MYAQKHAKQDMRRNMPSAWVWKDERGKVEILHFIVTHENVSYDVFFVIVKSTRLKTYVYSYFKDGQGYNVNWTVG